VQHALNNILEPIYEPTFLPYTFACRPNKGTHAGVRYIQSVLRKGKVTHFLKTDFSKYFPSIPCKTLYEIHDKKVHCWRTMELMEIDPARLRTMKEQLEMFVQERMKMTFSKWSIAPINSGINFLGYRIWPRHKLLRKQSVTRAKRALKSLQKRGDEQATARFLAAWTGHASWADTRNLFNELEIEK